MNNRRRWVWGLVFALLHAIAGAEECGVKDAVNLYKQAECVATSLGAGERTKTLIEQRLPPYQGEIGDMAKTDPQLKPMSTIALSVQKALEGIKSSSSDVVKLKQEIADFTLKSEAEVKRPDAAAVTAEAHGVATSIEAIQKAHAAAEKKLAELVTELGALKDPAAQRVKLGEIRGVGEQVKQKKKELDDAMTTVIAAAKQLLELESPGGAERALAQRAADLYTSNQKVIVAANLALDDMQARQSSAATEVVVKQKAGRLRFLEFLESHPLLGGELSGTGLQISSTAGDGKVTLKPEFQWGAQGALLDSR